MSKKSTSITSDDYPEITQKDIDKSTFRIGLKPVERKQRVSIMLDSSIIEWFKKKAGVKGYQTLINKALKEIVDQDSLQGLIRKIVKEELAAKNS